ncbi:Unknown protein, partial [Striga hermonthica]
DIVFNEEHFPFHKNEHIEQPNDDNTMHFIPDIHPSQTSLSIPTETIGFPLQHPTNLPPSISSSPPQSPHNSSQFSTPSSSSHSPHTSPPVSPHIHSHDSPPVSL